MTQPGTYLDLPLEEVIGDRFGRYSKYIIQDRALPDARDGLKPVQRRILYAMHVEKNTHDKNFRKSAKTVGTVIGNYHPHGDSSVYEAMVRLSQDWKVRNVLVEMHGNNGSIDGDPPAAMRYTEARLSSIASELLRDIDKDTVDFIPNFDDTDTEPVVLPAKFPNLLVNGSTGISAGYATDIPPHNLAEVLDAVILKIDKPSVSTEELMKVMKGPDFPTGGIIQGIDGIKKAYETGRGKIVVRGKTRIEAVRGNREQIIVDEIPYEVNKANMVKKIDELRIDRKVEGIAEVRDETDRTGLRIVIELKKDVNAEGVLNYLFKNTDLQVTYHFNMVAIQDKTPKQLSLNQLLESYIAHQKEVVTRQTTFDLKKAKDRAHIVEGLIKAISILDEVIQTIRSSKDKQDAKRQLIASYSFTEAQAEAIVMLQLYRLTNTDITSLEQEAKALKERIKVLELILGSEKQLLQTIKKDLRKLKKTYASPRLTVIEAEIEELKIDIEVMVASEDVLLSVTKDGYVKRTSLRSYSASNGEDFAMKEGDHVIRLAELNTTDKILLFTNKGKYIYIPVHELPDIRWKDIGQHLSNIVALEKEEKIITCIPVRQFSEDNYLLFLTKNGMAKRSQFKLYEAQRHGKALIALNLKAGDEVVSVHQTDGNKDVFITSDKGYGLWYHESEISVVGQRAAGVKAIQLKEGEQVVSGQVFDDLSEPSLVVLTQRGACKRMKLSLFEKTSRAKRGLQMLRELKSKPHRIRGFFLVNEQDTIQFKTEDGEVHHVFPLELSNSDRYSNGSFIIDTDNHGEVLEAWKQIRYEQPFENQEEK
ncbi:MULTISPECIES: DNA topoisomerase IV subunit A [Virgibacillus]|uniref:DNA topoisomerase 4 subunit A n=1 Tax=Virgibacillus pantothenticus TaxID=1473 RepID=A0A0L0QP08_VIRPA|nr:MULTISPECIES: DNA topoisomerase IV subunit A [Virgibacillus]API94037.1 DNA gyrase subunit A [Virgibacillus sp. 6R]KNE20289.1 DNA gyrase subunit A [Virgibacillus pantothenticus]MBS7429407.1 DNA topoisomerase IV subunit A [Virgibacillus sp. 19R1-5]MED3738375.1 DNA topoisomerase IV subunit A [Virgibacillus pantothenticus]QTY17960.1 DNA topoisomerase IV subunit A [Virgibacillus pantothenticus]